MVAGFTRTTDLAGADLWALGALGRGVRGRP